MTIDPRFYECVESLSSFLGQGGKRHTDDRGEIYTVSIDNTLSVDLVGTQEGFINLFSLIGEVEALPYEAILALLIQNNYDSAHPPISTGLTLQDRIGRITLWSRLKLDEATPVVFAELFGRFADAADSIRKWLEAGFSADETPSPQNESLPDTTDTVISK